MREPIIQKTHFRHRAILATGGQGRSPMADRKSGTATR